MIQLTLAEIADAICGRTLGATLGDAEAPAPFVNAAVVVDSRQAMPGGLFVARVGEQQDGHDYVAAAASAGAVGAIVEREIPEAGIPQVVVDDSERALGRLARSVTDRLREAGLTIVGVTGSSGKTTTKDLLAQVLTPLGPVVAPPGSYNTEVGVPLTALQADESTRTLIVEMGARGLGHIDYLCGITPPRIAVVLNVGSAHLGEFGDRDATARAKSELVHALPDDGIAVLNGDDAVVRRMAEQTRASVVMVGESVHADVRAEEVRLDERGHASFILTTPDGSASTTLNLVGAHQVGNALAAAGVAYALGMQVDEIAAQLAGAQRMSRYRMEVTERLDGVTIVNDAYNANPESVRAALTSLAAMAAGRRTWAVLGEMLELGETSAAEHQAIGELAVQLGVDRLVAVGEGAYPMHKGAGGESGAGASTWWVPDRDAAEELLARELTRGDIVLVKSSKDAGLRFLGDRLAEGAPA